MKMPTANMTEGPEALKRFEDTMRALFSHRKDIVPTKPKTHKLGRPKRQAKTQG